MPVYERGYKHWEPSGRRVDPPWWVIARRGMGEPLRSRLFLILIAITWVPAVVKGVMLYIRYQTGDLGRLLGGSWADIGPAGVLAFLRHQEFAIAIVLAVVGARLVSRDRREHGLALYLARPLSVADYVAGKGLVVLFYFFLVTLFQVWALSLFGYLVTAQKVDLALALQMLLLTPLRSALFCALYGASLSLILLALSSLGTRTVFVTVGWMLVFLGSKLVAQVVSAFGARWLRVLDLPAQYAQAGSWLFGAPPQEGFSPWASLVLIALYTLLAVVVLRRRIRPVEVVS